MEQKAFSFDNETLKKILKGLWIAMQYGLVVSAEAGCEYLLQVDWGFAGTIGAIAIPLIINTIRQYIKGK